MCLGGKAKVQAAPVVQPAPTRDDAAATATADRRRLREQNGVYGNVFTSVLGDPTYNTNVRRPSAPIATLGAGTAPL